MIGCEKLGCFIGRNGKASYLVNLTIPETQEGCFACDTCSYVWWVESLDEIPTIRHDADYTKKYFHESFWQLLFYSSSMSQLKHFNPSLENFKPIVTDEEFTKFENELQDNQMNFSMKRYFQTRRTNSHIHEGGILINRRKYFDNLEQAKRSTYLMKYWLENDLEEKIPIEKRENWVRFNSDHPNRQSKLILPSNYPNAISREVWDYIKTTNPEIQILNQENEPIPRP